MQLFVTHPNPTTCAKALDDARVVNQLRETVQLLSTAIHQNPTIPFKPATLYKPAHIHHPITKWVQSSQQNYLWTAKHAEALAKEYRLRFPSGSHKCEPMAFIFQPFHQFFPETKEPLRFADCCRNEALGLDFTNDLHGVCAGYRKYLLARWITSTRRPRWHRGYTLRNAPNWAIDRTLIPEVQYVSPA